MNKLSDSIDITDQKKRFKMNIWDIGGQTSLRGYWRNYYEQTDGLVWVIDSCDVGRIDCSKGELFQILREEVRSPFLHSLCASVKTLSQYNLSMVIFMILRFQSDPPFFSRNLVDVLF